MIQTLSIATRITTNPVPLWVPWALVGVGTAALIGGALMALGSRQFLSRAAEAQGEVVALEERTRIKSPHPLIHPVVVFKTLSGQSVRFTSPSGSFPPEAAVGDRVSVLYQAGQPEAARIRSFSSLWLFPLVFGGVGLAFLLLGAVGYAFTQ